MRLKEKAPDDDKDEGRVVQALECPHCGGTNIGFWSGYRPTGSYQCHDCGYKGAFIIKRRLRVDEEGFSDEYVEAPLPDD